MNKKYSIPVLLIGSLILIASPNDPPNGFTGAPGEGTCFSCHNPAGSQNGTVTVTGMPSVIEPNTTYMLTVTSTITSGTALIAGFQLTVLNSANQMAGTLSNPGPGSAIQTQSGRQYWEQNVPASYSGGVVTWTADWLSPTMPANTTITYYVANNMANGNGGHSGDRILTASGGGMLNGGGSSVSVSITNSTNILCNGQNTGSATALATGGVPPYTYHWSNGANTATINNLTAGTYTVTATDNTPSTATASVTITQPTALAFTTPTITNVLCNGGNNGSIHAAATGGVPPYFFDWSNGGSGPTISNLTAGSYTVTVSDDNSCTKTATYQVTQPPLIQINLINLIHESCFGAEDGAITIAVTGGVNPIFIEWSNGFIGSTITDLAPDIYSVTVTDNNDCTKTASYTINAGGVVNVTLNQLQNVSCAGGSNGSISVTATGGVGPYTYTWSNGDTGPVITGLPAGSYIVTATDSHGCLVVKGYTVTQPPAISVQIMQASQNLCFGDSTADLTSSASGGTPPFTALWSNGTSGFNNSNLHAGTYTVTVTDANTCTSAKTSVIVDPPQLIVDVTTTDETQVGANDGTATAMPGGGNPGYSYLWSNSMTTQTITGLAPGTYTVTITDLNACHVSGSGQVGAFGCSLDVTLGVDASFCEGDSLLLVPFVSGETGTVTYVWTDGSTGDSLVVSEGGEYCVTISDGAGCQDLDCITVTEIIIPALSCPVTNESAPGANDGAIQCNGIPGIATYLWSNGATTPSITGLPPGQYCVTVTDTNGCTKSQCFNVQPANCLLSINALQTNVNCAGDTTGSISISVNNATPPITYAWSNGDTTALNNNLGAGNYSITVTDATSCFVTDTFAVTESTPITITVDSIAPVQDFDSGQIFITVSGGHPPYTYLWNEPGGGSQTNEDLDSLAVSGYYFVTVTDATGCVASLDSIFVGVDVAVNQPPQYKLIKVYPVPTNNVLMVDMDGTISEALISGIDGRLYKHILSPSSNQLDVSELESGWYFIRISDGHTWYMAWMVK